MSLSDPFEEFRNECEAALSDTIKKFSPSTPLPSLPLEVPPRFELGGLSSSVCFELAKSKKMEPREVANKVLEFFDDSKFSLIESIEVAGNGYINFQVNFNRFSSITINLIRTLGDEYGHVKAENPKRVIVEHTSVNPIHPIHIGQARNPILGDSIAKILLAQGHRVRRHYYIDDVGRQSAVIAYGYKSIGKPKVQGKADHFMGTIYALTSCIIEVRRLKRVVESSKNRSEISKEQRELEDWMTAIADLKSKFPELHNKLVKNVNGNGDPELLVNKYIRGYEAGSEEEKLLIREVCQLCVDGFRETLGRIGILFDSWDWESTFLWNSDVKRTLVRLKATSYVFQSGDVWEFDAERVARDLDLKRRFGLEESYEISPLTLVRADGTTLYTTRDIAYSLWKFQRADKVINVVGVEQTLPQLQLKIALFALGHEDLAEHLIHLPFNLVSLPGYRMSSRKGRYVTLDEVVDEAISRAYEEVSKRSPYLSDKERHKIAETVGIGALKYALVEVDPKKHVVFTWDRVLDFEKNSAPYIQYTHARACSILRKAGMETKKPDCTLLKELLEREIILIIARFPEVFKNSAKNLKPSDIADYANVLSDKFNSFYTALPVIRAETKDLTNARLALVEAVTITLRNALSLLGIEAPKRM